jgi:hypothetical protein
LAHEWFHALDNLVAEHHGATAGKEDFVTEDGPRDKLPPELRDAVAGLHQAMHEGPHRITDKIVLTAKDRSGAAQLQRMASMQYGFSARMASGILAAGSAEAASAVVESARERDAEARQKRGKTLTPKQRKIYDEWRGAAVAHYTPAGTDTVHIPSGPAMSRFAIEAKLLEDPKGYYWSRPREMGARAFQAWCDDRLAGKGQKNDYLVGHANNKGYLFGEKPYPEGPERDRINGAFDRLFAAMRQHETLKKALEALDGSEALVKSDTEDGRMAREILTQVGPYPRW